MADNIASGTFKIVSRTEGNPPIGIHYTRSAVQFVRANGPVQQWVLRKDGDGKYRLSIGGYPYTGVINNKIAVSVNSENDMAWEISYHENQDTYTIVLADDPSRGWTTDPSSGEVEIKPIISTRSIPPQFFPVQLFAFERFE